MFADDGIEGRLAFLTNGNDDFIGTSSSDLIFGRDGDDELIGGAGDDTYVFERAFGRDSLSDVSGVDAIKFIDDITLNDLKFGVTDDNLRIYLTDAANPSQALDEISNVLTVKNWSNNSSPFERIELADGTSLSKIAIQSDGRVKFYGTDGDDVFIGTSGRDEIYGSPGADDIDGLEGVNIINYLLSTASVSVNLDSGVVSGGYAEGDQLTNITTVFGSHYDDVIVGDDGNNGLFGFSGDDHLEGGAGDDWLNAYGTGADYLDGGAGNDTARYRWSTSAVTVNLIDQTKNTGDAEGDTYVSIENVMGSDKHSDHITGDANDNEIFGYGGNDTLIGGRGNDTISGGGGSDVFVFESSNFGYDMITDF
ncbi:calcium-binding protein, partial [Pseudovibrio sp. POLY-S9]|uniref:calcium-binding protein n=1 Tax=Pseudovibrio sp. POLY-S9 TaxID=1576596 RepID=UPI00244EC0E9